MGGVEHEQPHPAEDGVLHAVDDRIACTVGVACLTRYENLIRHGQLRAHGHYYFVNSFHCAPAETGDVLGLTDYGGDFCSVVARGNIVATQFHAEKSGALGLGLLRGFAAWNPSQETPC